MSKRMAWPEPLASVVPECGVEKDDREGRRKNVSQDKYTRRFYVLIFNWNHAQQLP